MTNNNLIPSNTRKITQAYTIDESSVEWIEKNIPKRKRSAFVDDILAHRIRLIERRKNVDMQATGRPDAAEVTGQKSRVSKMKVTA